MAYNFRACDRDQAFLLPPDVREWLPADHLAWFVLDAVWADGVRQRYGPPRYAQEQAWALRGAGCTQRSAGVAGSMHREQLPVAFDALQRPGSAIV
jgi:hypothetical protein